MNIDLPDIDTDGGDLTFLLGVLFNQRVRSELAWQAPVRLGERLGTCDPFQLAATDPEELADVIGRGPPCTRGPIPWRGTSSEPAKFSSATTKAVPGTSGRTTPPAKRC